MVGKRWQIWIVVLAVVGGFAVAALGWYHRDALLSLDYKSWINRLAEIGPAPFFAAMAILPALWFPISPFLFFAGVFPTHIAIGGSLLAVFANMLGSWFVSSLWLRGFFDRVAARFGYSIPDFSGKSTSDIVFIGLLLRITPGMPFPLQNYILGVARMPLHLYILVSFPVVAVLHICLILFGHAILKGNFGMAVMAVFAFLVLALVVRTVRRRMQASKSL